MKILIGGKCAIITAAFAVILYCGCVGDGIGIAFLAEGGQFSSNTKYYSLKDNRDGKTYKVVRIGSRTWMAENLNYTVKSGSWCYDNKGSMCDAYGRLYTWDAAREVCDSMGGGWRLPDTADWNRLVNYAGGEDVAGKKLKSKIGWHDNTGTDTSGFSAIPGGYRTTEGKFNNVGFRGYWWSATDGGQNNSPAYHLRINYNDGSVNSGYYAKNNGLSVRCVR